MKYLRIYCVFVFFLTMICSPVISFGQEQAAGSKLDYSGLVQCDGVVVGTEKERDKECDFAALIQTVNHVIIWIIRISVVLFIGMFAYAGLLMMTPKPGNREKAKEMLWEGVIGFVIMISAWFLVSTLLDWLVDPSFRKGAGALIGN